MKKILVIGSANADLLIHTDYMPKLGETVNGRDIKINAGGKGLNQAIAVSKLGGNVTFVGSVGKDSYGDILLSACEKYNVDFKGIISEDTPTGIAIVTVVGGDNFIILSPGANNLLTPDAAEEFSELIKEADYVVLQLEIPVETVIKIAETAKAAGTKVVLNPAPYKELPEEIYKLTDIIIPNEHEAESLTGICVSNEANCIAAVKALMKKGIRNVIITLGERGCVYNDNNEISFSPAVKAKAIDTTSAGDTFIGAVITRLSIGDKLEAAIKYGAKASAITVSRSGASVSIPYAKEIQE